MLKELEEKIDHFLTEANSLRMLAGLQRITPVADELRAVAQKLDAAASLLFLVKDRVEC